MFKLLIASFFLIMTAGCGATDCGENSESANFARKLSDEKFNEIYDKTVIFFKEHERMHFEGEIPQFFSDIGIKTIRVHRQTHLRLNGCFDEWVDLVVYDKNDDQKIELWHSGGKELLWKRNDM